jgi:hypothetical protein
MRVERLEPFGRRLRSRLDTEEGKRDRGSAYHSLGLNQTGH